MFSKSVYSRWMVLLVLLMACSVLVLGCSQVSEKASEKLAEKALESASGGDVKVDLEDGQIKVESKDGSSSFKTGEDLSWPKSMPADVPQISGAKISNVSEASTAEGQTFMVWFEGISDEDQVNKFKADLEAQGWSISGTTTTPESTYIAAEKADWSLTATFNTEEGQGIIVAGQQKK